MNTTFKKDLKFTIKTIIVCSMIAVAVRCYNEIKDYYYFHKENQQVEQVK